MTKAPDKGRLRRVAVLVSAKVVVLAPAVVRAEEDQAAVEHAFLAQSRGDVADAGIHGVNLQRTQRALLLGHGDERRRERLGAGDRTIAS